MDMEEFKNIEKSDIVDILLENLNPNNADSVCCYDVDKCTLQGINIENGEKLKNNLIEIARINKDIDFECICDECDDECVNFNWKENNEEPPMPHMVEECIWYDTYDNLYDLYHNKNLINEIHNMNKKKEELKIKLAFQWGKFCEMRERTELSIEDDYDYVMSIIKTFNINWKRLSKEKIQTINEFFKYDENSNIYDILNQYDYQDVDNLIMNLHPIFKKVGKILGRNNDD